MLKHTFTHIVTVFLAGDGSNKQEKTFHKQSVNMHCGL
jgi:hypothetical protein